MNGGFSSTIGNSLYCTRGIKYEDNKFFVLYNEEVINFAKQFSEDQRISGFYDAYLRMPTEEDYLAEATRYSDGDITSYIAFIDGVKYAWKMFSTPRSKEYLENIDKNKSFDLSF